MSVPPTVLPHYNAILAALAPLADRPVQPIAIGDGGAPLPVPKSQMYAAVYLSPGAAAIASLAGERTGFQVPFQITAVGPTQEKCLWVADRVREVLAVNLPVTGRGTFQTEERGGPDIQRDDDVNPPVWFLPVQYRLSSIAS